MKPTSRLRRQRTGETVIEDQVQGRVVWQNENLDDLVLLRGDGNPTYMLAVVVDDHDMGVTHVIRGDDHLINAARQKQIYDALAWELPNMSHIPLIHGPDGSKLSKRHGALGVDAYRAMGYLPAALRNYLVRLGWSHGDQEIFSTQEMIDAFDLPAIGRSAARFDFAKLENLNGHYIRQADDGELVSQFESVLDYVPGGAERTHDFAGYFRCFGGAGAGGMPGPSGRSGGELSPYHMGGRGHLAVHRAISYAFGAASRQSGFPCCCLQNGTKVGAVFRNDFIGDSRWTQNPATRLQRSR